MEEKNTNKSRNLIIILAAALVVILGIGGFFAYKFLFKNDKVKVVEAFALLGEDINEYSQSVITTEELEMLTNAVVYGNSRMSYSLGTSELKEILGGFRFEGDAARSFGDKKMQFNTQIKLGNARSMLDFTTTFDGNAMYISIPNFFSRSFVFNAPTLAKDFNESMLSSFSGTTLPSELNFRPFGDGTMGEIKFMDKESIKELYSDDFLNIYNNMEVKKRDEKETIELEDETSLECKAYNVKITADSINSLMNDISMNSKDTLDAYGVKLSDYKLDDDLQLVVLIDDAKQIREIRTESSVDIDNCRTYIDVIFKGVNVGIEDTQINVESKSNGASAGIEADIHMDKNGEIDTLINLDGFDLSKIEYIASMEYDETDKELSFDIERFLLVDNEDATLFCMSGDADISAVDSVDIDVPDEAMDLLNAGIMDYMELAGELSVNSHIFDLISDYFDL